MEDRFDSLVPRPRSVRALPGEFSLTPDVEVTAGPGAQDAAAAVRRVFASLPHEEHRADLEDTAAAVLHHGRPTGHGAVSVHLDARGGPEGYRLRIEPDRMRIEAADPAGAFYAAQTAKQLLPDDAWRRAPVSGLRLTVPCTQIEDAPALPWRGAHLDVARHFFPKPVVLAFIDQLAAHKLNRFHLHLCDDQGWRTESRLYPRLYEIGSWRPRTMVGRDEGGHPVYDDRPHGGYYTLADLAEITAYAAERMITIVPEIDIPGHTSALLAALPELGARQDATGAAYEVLAEWGVFGSILSPLPATVALLEGLFGELLSAIPTPYLHIGGDECVLGDWAANPAIERYRRSLGLATPAALHAHFLRHVADMLAGSFGCRAVVWDEGFESAAAPGQAAGAATRSGRDASLGLRPDTIVMAWRNMQIARFAAEAGHDVVAAPVLPTYFDTSQSGDVPPRGKGKRVRLEDVAAFAPVPPGWPETAAHHLIGTQFQLWSEYIPDPRRLDYKAFPRGCVLAEVAWTGQPLIPGEPGTIPGSGDLAGWPQLRRRLAAHLRRLDAAGVEYRRLDGPLPWQGAG